MKKLIAASCCLMLLSPPLVLAQAQVPPFKAPPLTKKEMAEKDKGSKTRMHQCTDKAKGNNVQPGTPQFNRYMTDCIKP